MQPKHPKHHKQPLYCPWDQEAAQAVVIKISYFNISEVRWREESEDFFRILARCLRWCKTWFISLFLFGPTVDILNHCPWLPLNLVGYCCLHPYPSTHLYIHTVCVCVCVKIIIFNTLTKRKGIYLGFSTFDTHCGNKKVDLILLWHIIPYLLLVRACSLLPRIMIHKLAIALTLEIVVAFN